MSRNVEFEVGDLVRVRTPDGKVLEGIVMPSTEFSSPNTLVIKLPNGYNVGVSLTGSEIKVLRKSVVSVGLVPKPRTTRISGKGDLRISLISTGGTIVSKVEYETGAVKPAITAEELVEMVPDFREAAEEVMVTELYRVFSEDMTPEHWRRVSEEVAKRVREGYDAVIVAHGTDTMAYTASAVAFAVRNLPQPIMFVGAQRSSDRPSTDAVVNLRACIPIAREAPFGESVVVMHGSTSDEYVLAHRGVKVRKMHTSRRDAFQSVNDIPLGKVTIPDLRYVQLNPRYIPRSGGSNAIELNPRFSGKVALIKFYPGMDCGIIDYLIGTGYEGIVLEGTGLGHVRSECVENVRRAVDSGAVIAVTSQTLFGRVNLKVYLNGRRLLEAGAIPLSDMLPETAYVKLSWLLGNFRSRGMDYVVEMLKSNIVNEINPVHDGRHYPRWYHG